MNCVWENIGVTLLMAKVMTLNKSKKSRILQLLFHPLIGPHRCKPSLSNNHIHMSEYLTHIHMSEYLTQQLVSIISHSGSLSLLMMTWLLMFPSHWAWYCLVDWRVPGLFQYLMKHLIWRSHAFTSKNHSLNYRMALKFDTCLISQWSHHIKHKSYGFGTLWNLTVRCLYSENAWVCAKWQRNAPDCVTGLHDRRSQECNPVTPVECFSLSFRTHPFVLAFITHILCLVNLIFFALHIFQICNLFHCIDESWWNMPFKETQLSDGVAGGAVAMLLPLWLYAAALWRQAVWIRIVTSHNAWMGYEYSLSNLNHPRAIHKHNSHPLETMGRVW